MNVERRRALRHGCLALLLAARASHAQGDCDAAHAVALSIVDDAVNGATSGGTGPLEAAVIGELGASRIAVCAAPSQASRLARVEIRAVLPGWQRASIRLESPSSPVLERDLDVSQLPPEARALAIASATDELVRSALVDPRLETAETVAAPRSAVPVELDRPEPDRSAAAPGRSGAEAWGLFEAGLAAAGSSYRGQRKALEGELVARYWLLPRVALGARLGVGQRMSRPSERGAVQPDADVHAALGAGYALWNVPGRFDLLGEGGLLLTRVGFDERALVVESLSAPGLVDDLVTETHAKTYPLDHGWALAASLGLEGRARTGVIGFSLALAALAPLVPARSDWGNQTSLDAWGMQLRAGFWMVLESRSPGRSARGAKGS